MTTLKHSYELRVYYADTDAGGVVYHGRFLEFMERARYEWLASLGAQVATLAAQGVLFVVVGYELRYVKPARLGETLLVESRGLELKRVQFSMQHPIYNSDKELVVEAKVQIACVDGMGRVQRIPAFIQDKIAAFFPAPK